MLAVATLVGAGWSVLSRLTGRTIDFIVLLVLARVLTPEDFGLTALALSVVVIIDTVLEVPLIQALTRLEVVTRHHLDTAFTIGALRASIIFALVLIAAWPIGFFYDDVRLIPVVSVLALGAMSRGLVSPNMVRFTSSLNFRPVFISEVSGKLGSAALSLAVLRWGGGYWAIVASSVASPVIVAVASYVLAPYRPRFSLREWSEFREILGWISLSQLVSALNWQLDRVLLGRFIPPSTLGQYAMASDIAALPTQTIVGPAMSPLMAAFSRINQDKNRLLHAYLRAARLAMLIAAPACIGMAMTSDLLVSVLLGAKWMEAASYLRWIALTVLLNAYFQPLHAILVATRQTRLVFKINAAELALRLAVVPILIYQYAVAGALVGRAMISIAMFGLCLAVARRFATVPQQLYNLRTVAAACVILAVYVAAFRFYVIPTGVSDLGALLLTSGTGALVYISVLFGLGERFQA
jgi:PST family polysaccharide transporter